MMTRLNLLLQKVSYFKRNRKRRTSQLSISSNRFL